MSHPGQMARLDYLLALALPPWLAISDLRSEDNTCLRALPPSAAIDDLSDGDNASALALPPADCWALLGIHDSRLVDKVIVCAYVYQQASITIASKHG